MGFNLSGAAKMTSATTQHPLVSAHTATGALSSHGAPTTSPACDIPSGGLFPKLRVLDLFSGYTIREDGVVTSRFGRAIKQQVSKNGYVRVELWQAGVGKKHLLHRLLASAFIPNSGNKPQVNHLDGNTQNNSLQNLEWVTRSENKLHAYATGLQRGYKKSTPLSKSHKAALCGSRWAGQSRTYHAEGMIFSTPEEAASRFGLNRQSFYNRANSENFPSWKIKVQQEVK